MRIFYSSFFVFFLLQSELTFAEVSPIDEVVAVVNDDVILASQLQERSQTAFRQARQQGQSPPPQVLVPQVLERLIIESLQLQLASRAGVKVSPEELSNALSRIASQNKITSNQLKSKIEADGLSFSMFQKNIETEIILQQIQQAAVNKRIHITEQDITDFLHSEEGKLALADQFRLAHITLSFSEKDPSEKNNALALANDILKRIEAGEKFSDLAIQYSSSPDNANGGEIGWRSYKEVPSLYTNIVGQLAVNEISKPIVGTDAVYLVTLLEKKSINQRFIQQTQVRHILIKLSAIRNENDAVTLLQDLRKRALAEEDFGELAKTYSEDYSSALNNGDLGWTVPGQLLPQFQKVMDNTSINTISFPFQTQYGWHILQVTGRREKDMGEEMIRQSVRNVLSQRQFEIELPLWLQELRAEAYIVIKDPSLEMKKTDVK